MQIPYVDFYGLKLSILDNKMFSSKVNDAIRENNRIVCYGYSFGAINLMRKYPHIWKLGNSADIMLADGRPFYLLCRILGYPLKSDISIPNAVIYILDLANKNKYSVLLLGASQEMNDKACAKIRESYPNIDSVNGINGYYTDNDEGKIVDQVSACSPDVLLIGMNSPKKEDFVLKNRNKIQAKLIMPCGGMIDVLGGKTKATPVFIKKLGLASFYRLFQEPGRLFKRHMTGYAFIMFNFLPKLLFRIAFKRNENVNIPSLLKISQFN